MFLWIVVQERDWFESPGRCVEEVTRQGRSGITRTHDDDLFDQHIALQFAPHDDAFAVEPGAQAEGAEAGEAKDEVDEDDAARDDDDLGPDYAANKQDDCGTAEGPAEAEEVGQAEVGEHAPVLVGDQQAEQFETHNGQEESVTLVLENAFEHEVEADLVSEVEA